MKFEYSKLLTRMLEFVLTMRRFAFCLCFVIIPLASFSQNKPVGQSEFDEMMKAYKTADADLNKEYQRALRGLRPSDARNLRDAQQKWIAYRDAVCKYEYGMVGGGTIGPTIRVACLTRLTKERTVDLQAE
jgi:uncharacterized protein YecT (DUF1311 family)